MADDELALPDVPEPKPDDPEDVSWALSTAEAMWARGDHGEGLKWIRKAAEAASEAEDDLRALELAKVAADLAPIIGRRTRAAIDAPPAVVAPEPSSGSGAGPTTARSAGSVPPAALPSIMQKAAAAAPSRPPPAAPTAPSKAPGKPPAIPTAKGGVRGAPRPLATAPPAPSSATTEKRTVPVARPSSPPSKPGGKSRRKSKENLDAEAQAAKLKATAPHATYVDLDAAAAAIEATRPPLVPGPVRVGPDSDATMVAHVDDINAARDRSAAEWDASPTASLDGDELDRVDERARETRLGAAPAILSSEEAPPRKHPSRAPPALEARVHDPKIQTSQAVRVVVWRDANGVHVAPAGTVVSAITIDAVLVVLEPSADLTAWLSQR